MNWLYWKTRRVMEKTGGVFTKGVCVVAVVTGGLTIICKEADWESPGIGTRYPD